MLKIMPTNPLCSVYRKLKQDILRIESVQDFFDQIEHETMYASSGNKRFSLNLVIVRLDQILTQKNDCESTSFEMFEKVVHSFGKSEENMI